MIKKKLFLLLVGLVLMLLFTACGKNDVTVDTSKNSDDKALTPINFVLDWTPNTNHTGIYVAKEKGYFKDQGLDVQIMLPGEAGANQLLAAGKADFGITFQEEMTQARDEGLPIVSIAAIIQHNTAAFASPADKNMTKPSDFEGKVYGGYGSDMEKSVLQTIMKEENADPDKIEFLNIGDSDFFTAIKRDIDFANIFYAWTGIEAELRGQDLNFVYMKDFVEELDYYTPVIGTSEEMIKSDSDTVKAFMAAVSKGYQFAIDDPSAAANILIDSAPDLDPDLVQKSQEWLSPRYQDDAEQWGIQDEKIWSDFTDWMVENDIITEPINTDQAFTNEFLPEQK